MKKLFYLIIGISVWLSLASFSEDDKNKIAAAFNEWAARNVDDPDAIEKIMFIDSLHKISTIDFKTMFFKYKNICDSTERERENAYNRFHNLVIHIPKNKKKAVRENDELKELLSDNIDLAQDRLSAIKEVSNSLKGYEEEILPMKDTTVYQYEIRYKYREPGRKKTKKVYAVCDTLFRNIQIMEAPLKTEDIFAINDVYETVHKSIEEYEPILKLNLNMLYKNMEMEHILKRILRQQKGMSRRKK